MLSPQMGVHVRLHPVLLFVTIISSLPAAYRQPSKSFYPMDWYHRKTVNIISMTNCFTFGYCAKIMTST